MVCKCIFILITTQMDQRENLISVPNGRLLAQPNTLLYLSRFRISSYGIRKSCPLSIAATGYDFARKDTHNTVQGSNHSKSSKGQSSCYKECYQRTWAPGYKYISLLRHALIDMTGIRTISVIRDCRVDI